MRPDVTGVSVQQLKTEHLKHFRLPKNVLGEEVVSTRSWKWYVPIQRVPMDTNGVANVWAS